MIKKHRLHVRKTNKSEQTDKKLAASSATGWLTAVWRKEACKQGTGRIPTVVGEDVEKETKDVLSVLSHVCEMKIKCFSAENREGSQ